MGEAESGGGDGRQSESPAKQDYFCLSCGERFETGIATGASRALPACPACGGRDVEIEEPATKLPRVVSRYDRGVCPCEIAALSQDNKHRS